MMDIDGSLIYRFRTSNFGDCQCGSLVSFSLRHTYEYKLLGELEKFPHYLIHSTKSTSRISLDQSIFSNFYRKSKKFV